MEKLDTPRTKDYGPLVVWANDLFDLISELKDCEDIELIADDVKFESVEELIQERRGMRPSIVQIKARNPYLYIDLYPRWARVYVSSSQLVASGLFLKIDSVLSRCERKPRFFFSFLWPIVGVWTLPSFFFLAPFKPYAYLQIWTQMLTLSWMVLVGYIHIRKFSSVYPGRKEDRRSFFKRNADSIVIAVVSALLGAVGGAAATKVADRVWPNSPNTTVEMDASPQGGSRPSP